MTGFTGATNEEGRSYGVEATLIFNLPGLGRLMLDALNERDYPVVSAVNLFFATVVVVVNLLTDLVYASLDPRIRYE